MYTPIIATMLALPATPTDYAAPPFEVARVEIDRADSCAHVVALDSTDAWAGSIILCGEANELSVTADFPDDLYLDLSTSDNKVDSNNPQEAAKRMALFVAKIDPNDVQAGWGACLWATGAVVGSVATGNAPFAVANSFVMACECAPLVSEAYEDFECPWW
jgi:hypothetical protein